MIKRVWACVKKAPFKHSIYALAGGFIGALLVGLYFMPPKDSGQLASWVQAVGSVLALFGVYWATKEQARTQLNAVHEADRLRGEAEKETATSVVSLIVSTLKKGSEEISKGLSRSGESKKALIIYEWAELRWRTEPFDEMVNSLTSQNIGVLAFESDFVEFKVKFQSVLAYLKVNPKEIIEFYEKELRSVGSQGEGNMEECFNNRLDSIIKNLTDDINQLDRRAQELLSDLGEKPTLISI